MSKNSNSAITKYKKNMIIKPFYTDHKKTKDEKMTKYQQHVLLAFIKYASITTVYAFVLYVGKYLF